jgi:hypothetical protein
MWRCGCDPAQKYLPGQEAVSGAEDRADIVETPYVVQDDRNREFLGFPVLFGVLTAQFFVEEFSVTVLTHDLAVSAKIRIFTDMGWRGYGSERKRLKNIFEL